MAGIGFSLQRLVRQGSFSATVQAYGVAALASTGPWLITILALLGIAFFGQNTVTHGEMAAFRMITVYNFAFSLIFTAPVFALVTRMLADGIYRRDVSMAPGLLMKALGIVCVTQLPLVIGFYGFYLKLSPIVWALASANFMLISFLWLFCIFISAMRSYATVPVAYAFGMALAVLGTSLIGKTDKVGLLCIFSAGMGLTVALILARILAEFPYGTFRLPAMREHAREYWQLILGGLLYSLGIWADKFVMWFSPESERLSIGLQSYPLYDSAMFLAFLTIVPAMAFFLFATETRFHQLYMNFYRGIQRKVPFAKIARNHEEMKAYVISMGWHFLLLQGSLALLAILFAPGILHKVHGNYAQVAIFRFGVFGAFWHVLFLFLTILLSYFDARRVVLWLQGLFLFCNAVFTWGSMEFGFAWYGYGYAMACIVSFTVALITLMRYLNELPYHAFITTNSSVHK